MKSCEKNQGRSNEIDKTFMDSFHIDLCYILLDIDLMAFLQFFSTFPSILLRQRPFLTNFGIYLHRIDERIVILDLIDAIIILTLEGESLEKNLIVNML